MKPFMFVCGWNQSVCAYRRRCCYWGFVKCVRKGIDGVCFVPDIYEIAVSNEPIMEGNVCPTACLASEFVRRFWWNCYREPSLEIVEWIQFCSEPICYNFHLSWRVQQIWYTVSGGTSGYDIHTDGIKNQKLLLHRATGRKVAVSIPDDVIGNSLWHNPSGRTMALGLTQLLTEMSTRNISWGVKATGA